MRSTLEPLFDRASIDNVSEPVAQEKRAGEAIQEGNGFTEKSCLAAISVQEINTS